MAKTVVGLMENMRQAQEVVQELQSIGFDRDEINLIGSNRASGREYTEGRDAASAERTEGLATGAGAGAAVGGLAGFVAGLTALTIPGIGPILAIGPLGAALAGVGIGAVAGGAIGALTRMGVPEQDARYYLEGVKRGGILVVVSSSEEKVDQVTGIMQRHGAVDVDKQAERWKKEGWSGAETERRAAPAAERAHWTDEERVRYGERERVRGREEEGEEVKVGKREVPAGMVRVYTGIEEVPTQQEVALKEERAKVERHAVDRPATDAEEAFKETSVEIREMKEEPVVTKEARVKEEVVVGKEGTERMEPVHEERRRAVSTGAWPGERRRAAGFSPEDEEYLRHYQTALGGKGDDFDAYRSAYHYADEDSEARRYQGRDFSEIEEDIHRSWDRSHPGTWRKFKEAIRYGWNKKRHI